MNGDLTTAVHPLAEPDLDDALELNYRVFHRRRPGADEHARQRRIVASARLLGVRDEGMLVGTVGALPLTLTVPGATLPCAGVSAVGVLPTHRRRGLLSAMMVGLLERARGDGQPLASLWASESAIYGRFGFGLASWANSIELRTDAPLRFRVSPDRRPLRLIAPERAPAILGALHDRLRRPGAIERSADWWRDSVLHTEPEQADAGATDASVVILGEERDPAGYAIYRSRPGREEIDHDEPGWVELHELAGVDAAAEAALWSFLGSIDLAPTLRAANVPVDDSLALLLEDLDKLQVTRSSPATWLRIVDVPAALAGRGWAADVDLKLAVRDALMPANAGVWRLRVSEGAASCAAATEPADIELDTRELATAYLGTLTPTRLAAAGLVVERTRGALAALDRALHVTRAPFLADDF